MRTRCASCLRVSIRSPVCRPSALPVPLAFRRVAAGAARGRDWSCEACALRAESLCHHRHADSQWPSLPRSELSVVDGVSLLALEICPSLFCPLLTWPLGAGLALPVCTVPAAALGGVRPGFSYTHAHNLCFFPGDSGPFTCKVLTAAPVLFGVRSWSPLLFLSRLPASFIVKNGLVFPVNYPFAPNYPSLWVFLQVALWGSF